MTLYWGYRENKACNQNFLPYNTIGKVEDIVQFSKPHKDKKNNNIYALVGDTLDIYCLGMVKEKKPKYKGKLFIGQKVYATSKEELYLYYKEAAKCHRNIVNAAIKRTEQYLNNIDSTTTEYWATRQIESLKQIIVESEAQYKDLIERIKKL
jgi:hypothetical protein